MKYWFSLIYVFFVLAVNSQANSGIIEYKINVDSDYNKKDVDKVGTMLNETAKFIMQFEFELLFNQNNQSLFKIKDNLLVGEEETFATKSAKLFSGAEEKYYLNKKLNLKINEKPFLGELFLIHSSFNSIEWHVTKESKAIEGYVCYKATALLKKNKTSRIDRKITAWFCPDIPLNLGPKGYAGLPGLILELQEHDIIYYASKISFSEAPETIDIPTKGKKITVSEFQDYVLEKVEEFGF